MGKNHTCRWRLSSAIFLVIPLLILATSAAAQPAVSSVSGSFTHGSTVTISGSSFGTKSNAAPLVWENFADGTLNSKLTLHESSSGNTILNNTNNLRHQFATRNARTDYKVGDGYFEYNAGTSVRWFVQYWVKLASNWHWGTSTYGGGDDGLANIKMFRLYPTGSATYSNVGYVLHNFGGASNFIRFVETNGDFEYLGAFTNIFTLNAWHSVQVEYAENSGIGQANGQMRIWIDGKLRDQTTNLITNTSSDGAAENKRPYVIGFYDSWGPSNAAVSSMYAYYTDIYVDNTWARVELGNASTYAACTLRELQIPTVWGASSVAVQANQGAFTTGQTAYLYVVNANGQVNANGFPITVGGGPSAPQAPQNLRIVP